MTIGSILLGVALLVAVGLFVTRPLYVVDPHRRRKMSERQALLAQKEAVLVTIQNLDFDYETGKVAEDEYRQQREAYVGEAADLLMQIDELDAGYLDTAPEKQVEPELDPIEAAIARRRASVETASAPSAVDTSPSVPDAGTEESTKGPGNFCPQCGQPADAGDRFCAHCGHQLAQPQHA